MWKEINVNRSKWIGCVSIDLVKEAELTQAYFMHQVVCWS